MGAPYIYIYIYIYDISRLRVNFPTLNLRICEQQLDKTRETANYR